MVGNIAFMIFAVFEPVAVNIIAKLLFFTFMIRNIAEFVGRSVNGATNNTLYSWSAQ